MPDEYTTTSTSRHSAQVNDVLLGEGQKTRRILRSHIVENPNNPKANVKATVLHQKRHNGQAEWRDADSFNLTQVTAGMDIRLSLSSEETLKLFNTLQDLYTVANQGVAFGRQTLGVYDPTISAVVQGREYEILNFLMSTHQEALFDMLDELGPGMCEAITFKRQRNKRIDILRLFKEKMSDNSWTELNWQKFFKDNLWIFGHGLNYQILDLVNDQPYYGGRNFSGGGAQEGDYLMATQGHVKFTVLVEIKRPDSQLFTSSTYRNGVHRLDDELIRGMSQVQINCDSWSHDARRPENRELEDDNTYTCEPCGILVIGNTQQLDNVGKRNTFEIYRKNLHNPEIITFDELYARARFLVGSDPSDSEKSNILEDSDIPF